MRKISTLFKKDMLNRGLVLPVVREENMWVYESGVPTRKFDGMATSIINGELYRRVDLKNVKKRNKEKFFKDNTIIYCQENPDEETGSMPVWVKCLRTDPNDKNFFKAFDKLTGVIEDGTYEFCGPSFGSREGVNLEKFTNDTLIKHGSHILEMYNFSYEGIRDFIEHLDIEGIVFYDKKGTGKMCKVRKKDFGFIR